MFDVDNLFVPESNAVAESQHFEMAIFLWDIHDANILSELEIFLDMCYSNLHFALGPTNLGPPEKNLGKQNVVEFLVLIVCRASSAYVSYKFCIYCVVSGWVHSFHWLATLGKLFTHIASPVSQLQETGIQKGVFSP